MALCLCRKCKWLFSTSQAQSKNTVRWLEGYDHALDSQGLLWSLLTVNERLRVRLFSNVLWGCCSRWRLQFPRSFQIPQIYIPRMLLFTTTKRKGGTERGRSETMNEMRWNPVFDGIDYLILFLTTNEMKLILKFRKLMGLKLHQDGFKQANSLERSSAIVSMREKLMSTWWSHWKKDLGLSIAMFSNSDGNQCETFLLVVIQVVAPDKVKPTVTFVAIYWQNKWTRLLLLNIFQSDVSWHENLHMFQALYYNGLDQIWPCVL